MPAAAAAAGIVEDMPGTLAGIAALAVEARGFEDSLAVAVTACSPEVLAPASDCTEGHNLGTDARLAAVGDRAHIGRLSMAPAASCDCVEGP